MIVTLLLLSIVVNVIGWLYNLLQAERARLARREMVAIIQDLHVLKHELVFLQQRAELEERALCGQVH